MNLKRWVYNPPEYKAQNDIIKALANNHEHIHDKNIEHLLMDVTFEFHEDLVLKKREIELLSNFIKIWEDILEQKRKYLKNVSLYNTTQTSSIRPTPILLMMGISTQKYNIFYNFFWKIDSF